MKRGEKILFLISTILAVLMVSKADVAFASTKISADITEVTTWKKSNSPYVIDRLINIKAPLTIEPGVVVKLYDGDLSDHTGVYLLVQSDLTALGTADKKIVFTSIKDDTAGGDTNDDESATTPKSGDWGGIILEDNPAKITFDHVILSYADVGLRYAAVYKNFNKNLTVKNSEIKNNDTGFSFRNVLPLIEKNIISNNGTGIKTFDDAMTDVISINNNSIFNNRYGIDGNNPFGPVCVRINAMYNWWGDKSGPQITPYGFGEDGYQKDNPGGKGQLIRGSCFKFSPWMQANPETEREPVILVPGIGASINPDLMISGIFKDNWTMFDRTYDGIINAFKMMGYQEGKNFFIAYYDWRKSNTESAENYLKPIIQKALLLNPDAVKVNIVTHSMGSLVARSYVQNDDYGNDVDNLIMIAPPNKGSSDVYTAWEGGYIPKNWDTRTLMYAYIDYMSIKNATFNSYDVIHKFIPSLKELMPVYSYLHLAGNSQSLKNYLSMQEKNDFLLDLNSSPDIPKQKTKFSIILGDKQPTVNKIPTVDSDQEGIWVDGKPDPIDPQKNDTNGDGEVLLSSGDIVSDFNDTLEYGHREIVSEAEPIVMKRLGEDMDDIYPAPQINNEIGFWSEGPGDMEIEDPDGKVVKKDASNIENSKFAAESKSDGFKIASILNPKKGKYKVSIKHASKKGDFHVGSEYVDNTGDKNDSSSVASGTVEKDQDVNLIVDVDPENTEKPAGDITVKDEVAPIVVIDSPGDGIEYSNDRILSITFSVSDNVSKNENIKIEKYLDGDLIEGDSIDLSKLSLGNEHDFWINAIDEAENSSETDVYFKVKKADPPTEPPIVDPIPSGNNSSNSTNISQVASDAGSSSHKSSNHKKKSKHHKKQHKKKHKKKKTLANILGLTKRTWTPTAKVLGVSKNYAAKRTPSFWDGVKKIGKTLKDVIFAPFKYFTKH